MTARSFRLTFAALLAGAPRRETHSWAGRTPQAPVAGIVTLKTRLP